MKKLGVFHSCLELYIDLGFLLCALCLLSAEAFSVKRDGQTPKPCCLPFRFQAHVVPLASFGIDNQRIVRVTRDWEARLQIQQTLLIVDDDTTLVEHQVYSDFNHMIQYISGQGFCETRKVQFGMLEPCMPDNAQYLGKSYIGQYSDKANIDAWYFQRADQNRNIEMTIAVTRDKCVPVVEHITGSMGGGAETNTLVLFTNLTEDVADEAFDLPPECFLLAPI